MAMARKRKEEKNAKMLKWVNKWMDGWMFARWMDGCWMDGWMDVC